MGERRRWAEELTQRWVSEESVDQVNLSSDMRHALMKSVSEMNLIKLTRDMRKAKDEVFQLLDKNFFQRFAQKQKTILQRQNQEILLSGCFSGLWRMAGLDAYIQVVDHFKLVDRDLEAVLLFFETRIANSKAHMDTLKATSEVFNNKTTIAKLTSTNTACRSLFDT